MKRFALLRLQNGGNQVLAECLCPDQVEAISKFNAFLLLERPLIRVLLNEKGYVKDEGTNTSYCIAEYYENFSVLKA